MLRLQLLFTVFFTALLPVAGSINLAAERPNVVFIMADDCTFHDIGCYGGQAHTPHIDRLATEGMRMTACFQAAPMCSPTRHNIYTGLYPVKSGAYPNHTFAKAGTKSIVHFLKPLGYRVALCGKTHIGPREVFPFEYFGKGESLAATAGTFMRACTAESTPFCLFACSNEPHTPWNKGDTSRYPPKKVQLPPYLADTPQTRESFSRYLAEITYFDGEVGGILAQLDKQGLADNTLVMVVSEQGNSFPFAKWTCYDAGLGSIMVVRWPHRVRAGATSSALVEYVDICPTFVAAAGGTPPAHLDGSSFLPVLLGKTNRHKEHVYGIMTTRGIIAGTNPYPVRSIRSSQYKLIWNLNHEVPFKNIVTASSARQDFFATWVKAAEAGDDHARQLVHRYQHRPAIEFFDVKQDPLELHNLAGDPEHAVRIEHLKTKLQDWMQSQGDEGMATELRAFERQKRGKKKKSSR